MPACCRCNNHGSLFFQPERSERFGLGLSQRCLLDLRAFGIGGVKFSCYPGSLARLFLKKKADAEIGAAYATAGIDARAEEKPEVPWFRRTRETCHIHQRGRARILASP